MAVGPIAAFIHSHTRRNPPEQLRLVANMTQPTGTQTTENHSGEADTATVQCQNYSYAAGDS
jgi:hypothetical protein